MEKSGMRFGSAAVFKIEVALAENAGRVDLVSGKDRFSRKDR